MADLLAWIESSALGEAMRGSGVWTYGLVNLAHILGVSTLFGSVLVLDLRLLGAWRHVPLAALAVPTERLSLAGFALAAASGVCLIATNGTEYIGNPFLLIKFPAIAVGVVNAGLVVRSPAWQALAAGRSLPEHTRRLRVAGAVSLTAWVTAVAAGRMIGYW